MTSSLSVKGACMCGAVAFEAEAMSDQIDACHCEQCRRWSGHYWASVNVTVASLAFTRGEARVGWHESSDIVRRGFCRDCGSALFWHPHRHKDYAHMIAIGAGALDAPTGVKLSKHIFVAEKGDYYHLNDGLPQKAGH
ncbi:MAG: GFA family protein [Parvularculaceae bacterium]